jgi:Xaa-Pro dipeptidase
MIESRGETMTIPAKFFIDRQQKLSSALQDAGLDALALNPGPSLTYLTGLHFHLSERPVVGIFTQNSPPLLVLPELEAAKLTGLEYELTASTYGEDPSTWSQIFSKAFQSIAPTKIGVEYLCIRLLEYRILQSALPGAVFEDATQTVAKLRMYKDQQEADDMQKAVDIAEAALEATLPMVQVGKTEKEVASILVQHLLKCGSSGQVPFQPIVSTGPNGANPHAVPSDRKLARGDLIVIDFGANHNDYFSDITRTFAVAEYSPEQEKIYQTVLAANLAGQAAAAPGTPCGDVDQAAREVIETEGYGEYFIHRTGHGLGRESHEEPYMRARNPMLLEPGMTFTIEPGIYIPDRFGVRIEDNLIITASGSKSFSTFPRELSVIGG